MNDCLPIEVPTTSQRPPWRTAGVMTRTAAKLYVGRLTANGIDHSVAHDGRLMRISVRLEDLPFALGLRPESRPAISQQALRREYYRMNLRMLVSIPLGALMGSCLGYAVSGTFPLFSAASAVLLMILIEILARNRSVSN